MPTHPVIVRKKKTPVVVIKKEGKTPPPKKTEPYPAPKQEKRSQPGNLKPGGKQKEDKSKETKPVISQKVQQHLDYLKEIESMPSPEREIARACYFLCYLINEKRTTATLFPLKDKVLAKISQSGHDYLMVSYIRRWDRLNYRLTPEAKVKWEAETAGKKALAHLYRTRRCYVEAEKGYYDLYQFHIVVEPFRFIFYAPVELVSWISEERIAKPRLHSNIVHEYGLLRGKAIKMPLKSIAASDEQIKEQLQKFLDAAVS